MVKWDQIEAMYLLANEGIQPYSFLVWKLAMPWHAIAYKQILIFLLYFMQ